MSTWLVTGGAGYIGSHVVDALRAHGDEPVVLDDLSTGDRRKVGEAALVEGSIADIDLVRKTLKQHRVAGIIHIAAKKQVGESVADPLTYYRENVAGTIALLEAAVKENTGVFVFSSSASVYGMPDSDQVSEDDEVNPMSPYGTTKLVGEHLVRDLAHATGLKAVALRYFNVAGAARPDLVDPGAFNLVPLAFQALSAGRPPQIFGDDYPTPDGTCIRDYVHVADIADAHVAALHALANAGASGRAAQRDAKQAAQPDAKHAAAPSAKQAAQPDAKQAEGQAAAPSAKNEKSAESAGDDAAFRILNVGRGEGASVREVLKTVAEVTAIDLEPVVVARRPGDPARVIASVDAIRAAYNWTARYDLRDMVTSAWEGWLASGRGPRT